MSKSQRACATPHAVDPPAVTVTAAVDRYDVVVIGSGFGGSVAALRLTEKGYRVGVLEAGRRFADDELPKTSWDVRRFLWAPRLGCMGIQRIHPLGDVIVLAGAGVGGGSLVYANTLYEPRSDAFYRDAQWAEITDWRAELAPFYDQAKRMLGVVVNPTLTAVDEVYRTVADEMGVGHTFTSTPVGVFFGRDGNKEPGVEVDDPFFGGVGPRRAGCTEDGECITGCRHNAKNTLVKNYLYLAEKAGATVHPQTTATRVRPLGEGGYAVDTIRSGAWSTRRARKTYVAEQVIFAAGTLGTQRLLHRMRSEGTLPRVSKRLGELTRTNSEALAGAEAKLRHRKRQDFTTGVAITSSFHPDEFTHIEPVRYGKGSNAMALLATVMTDGGGRIPRRLKWLEQVLRHPGQFLSHYAGLAHWSERSTIALVMQTHDNSLTLYPSRGRFGGFKLRSRQGHGQPNPTWIPAANEACRRIAEHIDGFAFGSVGDILDIPMTAHFLGGCPIGDYADTGVIDAYHRLYGHPGVHVIDGAAISANLGVNPSLTITAQAERAMAMWPNHGDPDPRPPLGDAYRRLEPVAPHAPFVPPQAPAALRLCRRQGVRQADGYVARTSRGCRRTCCVVSANTALSARGFLAAVELRCGRLRIPVLPSSPLPARGAPASAPPSATAVVDEEGLGAAVAAVAANRERWAKTSVAERIGLLERVIADTLAAAPDWVADACRAKRIAPWLSVSAPHGTRFSPHRDLPVPSRLRRCTGFTPRPGRDEEATDRSVRTSTERHEMRKVLKTLLPAAIVAALFAFSGSAAMAADCEAAADTPVDQLAQPDAEAAVLCLTNNERDANGLAPLSPSDVLAGAARGHADDAVAIKWWVDGADPHTNPQTGSQPADRISAAGYCPNPQSWRVAENAFWAYQTGDAASAPTPRDAVTWWMGSPGHRANILDPGLTELGVGVVPDTAAPVDGDPIASGTFVADFGTCVN